MCLLTRQSGKYTISSMWSSHQKMFNLVSDSELHCTMNHLSGCVLEISVLRSRPQTQGFNWHWGVCLGYLDL